MAQSLSHGINERLRVCLSGECLRFVLRQFTTRDACAVAALGAYKLFPLVPHPMDRDPVRHIRPAPLDADIPDWAVFSNEQPFFEYR